MSWAFPKGGKPPGRQKGFGDPGGIRTHDHSIKSRVLYQLSYGIMP